MIYFETEIRQRPVHVLMFLLVHISSITRALSLKVEGGRVPPLIEGVALNFPTHDFPPSSMYSLAQPFVAQTAMGDAAGPSASKTESAFLDYEL